MFLNRAILLFLIFFLIFFPKGGIKVASIPLTWGYMALAFLGVISIGKKQFFLNRYRLGALLAMLPFQLYALIHIWVCGYRTLGNLIAFFVSLFALPFMFFYLFGDTLHSLDRKWFYKWVSRGVFFTAMFGIFLFFCKFITGHFFTIPLITINLNDIDALEAEKFNMRLGIYKLFSTYNNGNLYGVCTLILLPIFYVETPSFWRRSIVRLALILTLSRSIWGGMIAAELLYHGYVERKLWRIPLICGALIAGILAIATLFNRPLSLTYLFDPEMGGRLSPENMMQSLSMYTTTPFHTISEFIYFGILRDFGLPATLLFTLGIAFPSLIYFYKREFFERSMSNRALAICPLVYLVTALSDGAILLIPTLALYWCICSLLLEPREMHPMIGVDKRYPLEVG